MLLFLFVVIRIEHRHHFKRMALGAAIALVVSADHAGHDVQNAISVELALDPRLAVTRMSRIANFVSFANDLHHHLFDDLCVIVEAFPSGVFALRHTVVDPIHDMCHAFPWEHDHLRLWLGSGRLRLGSGRLCVGGWAVDVRRAIESGH